MQAGNGGNLVNAEQDCAVVVIGGGMYYELIVERRAAKAQRLPKERMEHKVGEIVLLYTLPSMLVAFLGGWWLTRRALGAPERHGSSLEQRSMTDVRHGRRIALPSEPKGGVNARY